MLDEPAGDEPFEVSARATSRASRRGSSTGCPTRELRRYLEPFLLARFAEPVVLLAPDVRVRGPLDALLGGGPALVPRVLEPAGEEALAERALRLRRARAGGRTARACSPGGASAWRSACARRAAGRTCSTPRPRCSRRSWWCATRAYGVASWNLDEPGRSDEAARHAARATRQPLRARRPLATLANGAAVDAALRDVLRDAAAHGIELADLDTEAGTHRLLEWANGPADRGAVQGVTRYLLALHGRRLDLHDTFRALEDDDGEAFVHWARTTGRADGIPGVLLPLPAPESAPAAGEPPPLGVNVAGYLRTGLGVGEAARLYVAALEAAQVPVRTETADPGLPKPKRDGLRGPPARGRVPVQPRLRQRVRAARASRAASAPASSRTA